MSHLTFSKELVDATVRYLASRPYNEVAGLLERFNQEAAPQLQTPDAPQLQAVAAKSKKSRKTTSSEVSNESNEEVNG